ncbi:MAG: L-2-hydroxyglutarate oxidase [Acidobacteria bacterium]|nr:L-2-hydroxyglutarate oxidase [Acidobacteriota bacterium]
MRVTVIGGGIIGLATAYRAQQRYPRAVVTVLEKEAQVGRHQSGNNSGVLHCGLYYKPGSVKARMAVSGIRRMIAFCEEHGIRHEVCGKLVVAVTQEEVPRLEELHRRGTANGLRGLRRMGPEEMREIEPHVAGVAAVRVPEEGIADYKAVCAKLAGLLSGAVRTGARVMGIRRDGAAWRIESTAGDFAASLLINCAGLHCDKVAEMAGVDRDTRIVPFRGEYFELRPEARRLVKHLIYPVPDPAFPFLGVHFTRMIGGGVECGPNAVLAFAREGYRMSEVRVGELVDALAYPGLWAFLRRYPAMCWYELRRSLSRRLFCESLQRLVPEVREEDLAPGGAGVRAQALTRSGELVQDFDFRFQPGAIHVLNAPSPGATASLAIGDEILDEGERRGLVPVTNGA